MLQRISLLAIALQLSAQPYPTPPPDRLIANQQLSISDNNQEPVDRIERIDVAPTQFVIVTTKEGPGDQLRVHLEVTDLHDHRVLPPVDVQGIWVLITRGRYTIPFLKPDRWYGLTFRSENIVNNRHMLHTEERLVHTSPRNRTDHEELFEVELHRDLEGEENPESLYITARWIGDERLEKADLSVHVRVECTNSVTKEEIRLPSNQDTMTMEISMDHQYNLEALDKASHRVLAHITPLKCHRVCWRTRLELVSGDNVFSEDHDEECSRINGTTSTAYLRNIKQYAVVMNDTSDIELVVETEMNDTNEEGLVTLRAWRIEENGTEDHHETFSTKKSDGVFHLPLEEDSVYAVEYDYTKIRPFHYEQKDHFLVDTTVKKNSSDQNNSPVYLRFLPETFKIGPDGKTGDPPAVHLVRGSKFDAHDITVHLDPFCDHNRTSIVLNATYPHHEIDVTRLLCSVKSSFYFCDHTTNYTACNPMLCHSVGIHLHHLNYPSAKKCVDVTQHFDIQSSATLVNFSFLGLSLIYLTL